MHGRGPRVPRADGPPSSPSTWSAAPGVCTQRSWKMLLRWKGFRGHCQVPAAAPGPLGLFFFASPAASRSVGRPSGPGLGLGCPARPPRSPARGRGRWERRPGPIPPGFPPGRGPRLLVRPRAQPRAPSRRVEVVAGGTGRRGPRDERGALGLRPREQRRDGAQPHRQAAAHRGPRLSPPGPARGPRPASARRAAPPLALPPGSRRRSRPPELAGPAAWRFAAAASRRVVRAARRWGRGGEAGGGLCAD